MSHGVGGPFFYVEPLGVGASRPQGRFPVWVGNTHSRPSSLARQTLLNTVQRKKISLTTPDNCEHGRDEPSVCLCGAAPEGTYPAGYLDEIRQQLDALAAEYGDGDLSLSEWRAASKPLMERLRQIEEAHLSPGEALQKSAADIGRDLVEVVADYASDRVSHAEWLILREGLKKRIDALVGPLI